ncbi:hypothetical protein SDC9_100606 [bioreactor metagenome]|uniref:Uncharacterized protein n=1 Tax=bioreactor metagenome TaxID=1076179 RepID=A0A645ALN1_9ZZZZ
MLSTAFASSATVPMPERIVRAASVSSASSLKALPGIVTAAERVVEVVSMEMVTCAFSPEASAVLASAIKDSIVVSKTDAFVVPPEVVPLTATAAVVVSSDVVTVTVGPASTLLLEPPPDDEPLDGFVLLTVTTSV